VKTSVLVVGLLVVAAPARAQTSGAPDTVAIQSGGLTLRALLWTPRGSGPFPAVLFNHGSYGSRDTMTAEEPTAVGPVFARHGYVFLFLFRRGVGLSSDQGKPDGDLMDSAFAARGQEGRNEVQLELLETEELNEALAALAFLRALPRVDARRVAVAGHSFGGSLALLLGARDPTLGATVVFGGAAGSWPRSPELRSRLLAAVHHTPPVFLIHAENDYSTAPGKALSAEMQRLGRPCRLAIYPPFGRTGREAHSLVYRGVPVWEADVFGFLDERMRGRM
jgi:carboxymethylenebutenolidase